MPATESSSNPTAAEVIFTDAHGQILIVDRDPHHRELLRFMLEEAGYHCLEAATPSQAVQCWRAHPALELMVVDACPPELEGLEVARRLRAEFDTPAEAQARLPGIIFMAAHDPHLIEQCLAAGGDDVLPRPVNERLLLRKIEYVGRARAQAHALQDAQTRLQWHQHHLEREHRMVEHLFSNNLDCVASRCENLVAHSSPLSMFNGDLLLSAPSPSGGVYVLLCHFSGRGLTAALGAAPAAKVFFRETRRPVAIAELALELNRELYRLLPSGMYCCATLLYLEPDGQRLSMWSGGGHDVLFVSPDGSTITALGGDHVPLGVLPPHEFDSGTQMHELAFGGHLYLCTETLFEVRGENGERFDEQRYRDLLRATAPGRVAQLVRAVQGFQGAGAQRDTFSLVEIHCAPLLHRRKITREILTWPAVSELDGNQRWRVQFELAGADLRRPDPLVSLMASLRATDTLSGHEDKLYTIVSELFRNSLDYGLLDLDPALKRAPGGLAQYNQLRTERLTALRQEFVKVAVEFTGGDPHRVTVTVAHGGRGFDAAAMLAAGGGRGLKLLRCLCSELTYSDDGRTAIARYAFRSD